MISDAEEDYGWGDYDEEEEEIEYDEQTGEPLDGRLDDEEDYYEARGTDMNWFRVTTTDYYHEYEEAVRGKEKLKIRDRMPIIIRWRKSRKLLRAVLHVIHGQDWAQIDMNNVPDKFPTQQLTIVVRRWGKTACYRLTGDSIRPQHKKDFKTVPLTPDELQYCKRR